VSKRGWQHYHFGQRRQCYFTTLLAVFASACYSGGQTGIGDGGVRLVTGEYCTRSDSVWTDTSPIGGNYWSVAIYTNRTTYRDVAGTDGIVRRQQVRSCDSKICLRVGQVSSMTSAQALERCRQLPSGP